MPLIGRKNIVKNLAFSTFLTLSFCATPLWAQTVDPSPYKNIDGNGVDLTDGSFNLVLSEGSIGNGEGGIELMRFWGVAGWRDNWAGVLSRRASDLFVDFGLRSEQFSLVNNVYVPKSGDGSTLTFVSGANAYVYRDRDGQEITYTQLATECSVGTTCNYRSTSVRKPNGVVYDIVWDVAHYSFATNKGEVRTRYFFRLKTISSSAGYVMNLSYVAPTFTPGAPPVPEWYQRSTVQFTNSRQSATSWPTINYSYPSTGVIQITTPGGKIWKFTEDASGELVAVKRPGAAGNSTTIAYNANGVSSVVRDGITTNYNRTVSNNIATMTGTGPLSQTISVVSDMTQYRPASITDGEGKVTSYAYDTNNRPTEITYPEGNKLLISYDARGNVISQVRRAKAGSGLADVSNLAGFAASCTNLLTCNKPLWTKDGKGNQTDYSYDPNHGGVLTVTSPAAPNGVRPQERYGYTLTNGAHLLTSVNSCSSGASCTGSANESRAVYSYNSNFLPIGITSSSGDGTLSSNVAIAYDAVGNRISVDGPLTGTADTVRLRYDADRRVVGEIGPDPDGTGARKHIATRYTYNADDQVTKVDLGNVNSQSDADWAAMSVAETLISTYDANGRQVRQELKTGSTTHAVTQYSYDALGRLDCTAQRLNPAIFASLPSSACTLGAAGTGGYDFGPDRIRKNFYDRNNRVTKVQAGAGTGDAVDEMTAGYTNNGQLAYIVDAELNRTTYVYDGHDRLWQTKYPVVEKRMNVSSASDYEQLTYDANDNVTQRRLRDGTLIGYGYDKNDLLVSKDLPGTEPDASFTYDLLGRALTATQDGQTLSFVHDALGRNIGQSGPLGTISYVYDAAGRRTRMTYPGGGLYIDYDYDVAGDVTRIRENGATSGSGIIASYGYDSLGRKTSVLFGNGVVQNYGFDAVSRLTSLSHDFADATKDVMTGFTYNPAHQIKSRSKSNDAFVWTGDFNVSRPYESNGLNQYTKAGAVTIAYDARGNLTSSDGNIYGYSSENFLKSGPNGASFRYDPVGRLYETVGGGNTTRFAYDETAMIAEYNASNGLLRRYVHGPGVDEPILWYEGSGTTDKRYLTADERGSITSVTNAAGTILQINSYDDHGIPATTNLGRFQYTGQTWLPEVGLYYYKARIYSPTLGRFLQTDPIGYEDGLNWYDYVGGDPVNGRDPTGLAEDDIRVVGGKISYGTGGVDFGRFLDSVFSYGNYGRFDPVDNEIVVVAKPKKGKDMKKMKKQQSGKRSTLEKLGQCTLDQLGLGEAVSAAAVAAGQPIPGTKPFVTPGSSRGTSAAGMVADKLLGKTRLPARLPTIVGGPGTGRALAIAGTKSAARFAGRAVPIVGWALLAYDAAGIAICTASSE